MRKEIKNDCIILIADEGKVLNSKSFENVKIVNVPIDFDLEQIEETEKTEETDE